MNDHFESQHGGVVRAALVVFGVLCATGFAAANIYEYQDAVATSTTDKELYGHLIARGIGNFVPINPKSWLAAGAILSFSQAFKK